MLHTHTLVQAFACGAWSGDGSCPGLPARGGLQSPLGVFACALAQSRPHSLLVLTHVLAVVLSGSPTEELHSCL